MRGSIVRHGAHIAKNVVLMPSFVNIGARAEVAEGVIVREGAVLAMGVYLSGSTKIVDRATGEVFRGEVPAYSVVVPGSLPDPNGGRRCTAPSSSSVWTRRRGPRPASTNCCATRP